MYYFCSIKNIGYILQKQYYCNCDYAHCLYGVKKYRVQIAEVVILQLQLCILFIKYQKIQDVNYRSGNITIVTMHIIFMVTNNNSTISCRRDTEEEILEYYQIIFILGYKLGQRYFMHQYQSFAEMVGLEYYYFFDNIIHIYIQINTINIFIIQIDIKQSSIYRA